MMSIFLHQGLKCNTITLLKVCKPVRNTNLYLKELTVKTNKGQKDQTVLFLFWRQGFGKIVFSSENYSRTEIKIALEFHGLNSRWSSRTWT